MTDPTASPPTAEAPKQSRLTRWLGIGAGIVVVLVGITQLAGAFVLPGCDSSRSLNAVRSIFKDKNLPEPTLSGARSAGGPSGENSCAADYVLPNEKGELSYRVFWDGWSAKVMITKADAKS